MASLNQLVTGVIARPRAVTIYGTPGIGKSTWAAQAPGVVFVPTETGLDDIGAARFPKATSLDDFMGSLQSLAEAEHDHKVVVIDTIDELEKLIWRKVCEETGKDSIEQIGYAKGYIFALEHWRNVLEALLWLRENRDMSAILIGHAKIERFENPETDSYDRYSLALNKHAAHMLVGWSDEVLFASYRVMTKQTTVDSKGNIDEKGKKKRVTGMGTGERILRTMEMPAYVAKNRINLPEELPLEYAEYAKHLPQNNVQEEASKRKKKEKPKTDTSAILEQAQS